MPHRSWKPATRRRQLVIQRVVDQAVVYDTRTHQAYGLTEPAFEVFDLCDGTRTVEEIVNAACSTDRASVEVVIDALATAGLFVSDPRMLRRQAMTIPLAAAAGVTTMLVPNAAFASSCVGLLGNCASRACCPGLSCILSKLGIPQCS